MRKFYRCLKMFLAMALVTSLVSGCGNNFLGASYPLESVTQNGAEYSRVYRAENQSVPEVAKALADEKKPQEISKEDPERMFIVYPDELYHLQRDAQKPSDTLIEVDSKEFVQQNYNPGFLEGFILASILDNLFDSHKSYPGNYRGYGSKDIYKPNIDYRKPTANDQKMTPPLTKQGIGSIIKRDDKPSSNTVGSDGNLTQRSSSNSSDKNATVPPATGGSGTIVKTPSNGSSGNVSSGSVSKSKSSSFSPPKINSPPKTRIGGKGSITRRR